MVEQPAFVDLHQPTVPCTRCGQPIPLKSFRLPPKLCDRCRSESETPGQVSDVRPPAERSSSRRIVKRIVLSIVVVALVLASYIGWWCSWIWNQSNFATDAILPQPVTTLVPDWVFVPLQSYANSDLPGNETLLTLELWSGYGGKSSWDDCREQATSLQNLVKFREEVDAYRHSYRPPPSR